LRQVNSDISELFLKIFLKIWGTTLIRMQTRIEDR